MERVVITRQTLFAWKVTRYGATRFRVISEIVFIQSVLKKPARRSARSFTIRTSPITEQPICVAQTGQTESGTIAWPSSFHLVGARP